MVEKFLKIFKWEEIHRVFIHRGNTQEIHRGNTQEISERVVIKDVCLVSYGVKTGWKGKNSWINYSVAIKKWDTIPQWEEQRPAIQNSKTNFADIMLKPGTIKHTLYYYI